MMRRWDNAVKYDVLYVLMVPECWKALLAGAGSCVGKMGLRFFVQVLICFN